MDPYLDLQRICQAIAEACSIPDLDERELVTRFFEEGFFSALGYGRVGEDVRLMEEIDALIPTWPVE